MTLQTFHLLSLTLGIMAYAGLTVFCIVTWARKITGRAALSASLVTLFFLLAEALTGLGPIAMTLQAMALFAWMVLLARVIGVGPHSLRQAELRPVTGVLLIGLLTAISFAGYAWVVALAGRRLPAEGLFAADALLAIAGLVLLEQVVRNTREDLRARLFYLNVGIGTLFFFQLVHGAVALLFNGYMPALVAAQPAVYAIAVPFIAIASIRNPDSPLKMNLSREFVFRSGTLLATGMLLLLLGALGYLVRLLDGSWAAATLALLGAITAVATVAVFANPHMRRRGRRWIEENLFPRKHDYRDAWKEVTRKLTEPSPDFNLPQQVIRALGSVLDAPGGGIWQFTQQGLLIPVGQLHTRWQDPLSPTASQALKARFEADDSILDLRRLPDALARSPAALELNTLSDARFLVPLMADARLIGLAILSEPPLARSLTWEDDDVLKLIARQAAGFVALREAERELAEADKLNSFSQVSAFIVHDVKTISAQLSLLAENASRHRNNPQFIDDMVNTVDNSVMRMRKLLEQLRGEPAEVTEDLNLPALLQKTLSGFAHHHPPPELTVCGAGHCLTADAGKLRSAVSHLVQNAVDAANARNCRDGQSPAVKVELRTNDAWIEIAIQDNGAGMDQAFIDQALFQPFTSTKGVAGMGVGAYQARSYIRSLGGDISVRSRPDHGTTFTIKLPRNANHE